MRSTHTYAVLEISKPAWDEIAKLLMAADYGHAFSNDGNLIDMHGIALQAKEEAPAAAAAEVPLLERLRKFDPWSIYRECDPNPSDAFEQGAKCMLQEVERILAEGLRVGIEMEKNDL